MEPNGKLLQEKLEGSEKRNKDTMALKAGATIAAAGVVGNNDSGRGDDGLDEGGDGVEIWE